MIWKKKKDAAAQSAEAAGEMTGAKGRTGAGAFAKKNWKWLVPLVVVAAAGAVFLIGGGRNGAASRDVTYAETTPTRQDVSNSLSGTGTLNPANTYTVKSLVDGKILTGKTSELLGCSSALLLNALKYLGNIPDEVQLISPSVIEPVQNLKVNVLGNKNPRLHIDELLVALSICAVTDANAKKAVRQLQKLRGCEAHTTVILSEADEDSFRRLGVRLTSEPKYQTSKLYHG